MSPGRLTISPVSPEYALRRECGPMDAFPRQDSQAQELERPDARPQPTTSVCKRGGGGGRLFSKSGSLLVALNPKP